MQAQQALAGGVAAPLRQGSRRAGVGLAGRQHYGLGAPVGRLGSRKNPAARRNGLHVTAVAEAERSSNTGTQDSAGGAVAAVTMDNQADPSATVIKLTGANRPGVHCHCEVGLRCTMVHSSRRGASPTIRRWLHSLPHHCDTAIS